MVRRDLALPKPAATRAEAVFDVSGARPVSELQPNPSPTWWLLGTVGPGGALLARRLVLGGASSPVAAADPWLVGPWSDYGCRVLGPSDRPGKALLAYRI